jgi:hypothetical protein
MWRQGFADGLEPRVGVQEDGSQGHAPEIGQSPPLRNARPCDPGPSVAPRRGPSAQGGPMSPDTLRAPDFDEVIDRRGTHCSNGT